MRTVGPTLILSTALALACVPACGSGHLDDPMAGGGGSTGIILGGGGSAGTADGGVGGAGTVPPTDPCRGDADPRLVVAPQRTLLLTSLELINMVGALVGDVEARAVGDAQIFPVLTDLNLRFPPQAEEQIKRIIDIETMMPFTNVARHVATYVFDNFTPVTGCAPATDACAKTYLDAFAEKAFRRPLDATEQSDLAARYETARAAGTTEDATREVVAAILVASPFLYRSEMGDPTHPSVSPPGLPLTPYELASALSFFLTNGPPDQRLLDDARAGTLSATLPAHVDRLLATPAARAWLTKVIELLYDFNELPAGYFVDPGKFPEATPGLYADLQTEAHLFLDDRLWNGNLADLLLSRTTFLNSTLATVVYQVPVPVGATATSFVRTTLPADQRSGILTNAGFLATRARDGAGLGLLARGESVTSRFLGRSPDPPPFNGPLADEHYTAYKLLNTQTAQEQVAYRASRPECWPCHVHFDPYGLALDNYDAIGRLRTVGDLGEPVYTRATLPPELGGVTVANAVELAGVIARNAGFENAMARFMLEYAVVDFPLEMPDPTTGAAGCAVADVVRRFDADGAVGGGRTFSGVLRAVAISPAFQLRSPATPPP